MKIVILGSVALPVPPVKQGGTERIAYLQAKGLAARGHQVVLIAARGSGKDYSYQLVEIGGGDTGDMVAGSITQNKNMIESSRTLRKESVYLAQVAQWLLDYGKNYDVILNNMRAGEAFFLPIARQINIPLVNVMHLPIFSQLADLFLTYQTPLITISNAQRQGFSGLNYLGTVYNGLNLADYPYSSKRGTYLLMMGSIAPHKNQKTGIDVAKKIGLPIILAGKIGNQVYFNGEIAPLLKHNLITHYGELDYQIKIKLYQEALALIFPIVWPEPFGLVMIEAMATGTPVVAYGNGAVPEVVNNGKTGFVVDPARGTAGLVESVKRIDQIDRAACRTHVEMNFTADKMLDSLESALRKLLQ